MNTRVRFPLVVAAAALLLAAGNAAGPSGFAEKNVGKSVDEVRKDFPMLEELGENEKLVSPVIKGPAITRYGIRKMRLAGLAKPVDVEWRFWNGKLWVVIVSFGDNSPDEVAAAIRKERGTDPGQAETQKYWYDDHSMVAVAANQGWYTISDMELGKEALAWFAKVLGREVIGGPTPAATREEQGAGAKATPAAPAGETPEKVELLKPKSEAKLGAPAGETSEKVELLKPKSEAKLGAPVGEAPEKVELLKPKSEAKLGAPAGEAPEKVELLKPKSETTLGAPVGEAPEKVELLKPKSETTLGAPVPLVPGSATADD